LLGVAQRRTVVSLTMNNLSEPSSTLSVQENQVRGMSNTTYQPDEPARPANSGAGAHGCVPDTEKVHLSQGESSRTAALLMRRGCGNMRRIRRLRGEKR
jgi:hypothetical protein